MSVIYAVVEFERDLLLDRTHSGIARVKTAGKRFGRPSAPNEEQQLSVITRISSGVSISAISQKFNPPGKQYSELTVCYVLEEDVINIL